MTRNINNQAVLVETQFLPSLYYICRIVRYGAILLEQHENYNKGSFRNKCLISSNQKSQYMIIPLKKGKHRAQPIREVQLSYDEDWPRMMAHRLQTEYGKYPYYSYYIDEVLHHINKRQELLFELNDKFLNWIFKILHINNYEYTRKYKTEYEAEVYDLRDKINPRFFNDHQNLLTPKEIGYFTIIPGHSVLEAIFSFGPEVPLLVHQYSQTIPMDLSDTGKKIED